MNSKTFDSAVHQVADEVANTVIKKNHDYGSKNIMSCPVGPEVGLIVRLFDKLHRLANLYKRGDIPSNESLRETWLDVAGYGQIGMMVCDKTFELPMEE